jgi:hypothetical protein
MTAETQTLTTRSVGVQYGLIATVISVVLFLIPAMMALNPFKGVWNWSGAIVSLVLLILAHKKFKDEGDGFMSFGQGMGIAFWMVLVSTFLGFGFTYVYLTFIDSAPFELFMEDQLVEMQESGTPDSAIETAQEWTRKLFWPIGFFFALCGGLLFALIVTIFTQKKSPEATF